MKAALKAVVDVVATLWVLPSWCLYQLAAPLFGRQKTFAAWSESLSKIPGLRGVYLRRAFYRLVLTRCDKGSWVGFGVLISHPTASIGRGAYVGPYCVLGDVTLEDDVLLGSQVSIMNGGGQHGIERLDIPIREQPGVWSPVTIGRDTWIGDRAVVLADIGQHCVIGAGSVVTKPVPDYAIAVGSPARIVRYRNQPEAKAV